MPAPRCSEPRQKSEVAVSCITAQVNMSSAEKTGNMAAQPERTGLVSPLNPSVAAFEFTSPASSVPSSPDRPSSATLAVMPDGDEVALHKQLMYYFSDQNLAKDAFLVAHMNADMFVPIVLVAGFRNVQARTADVNLVAQILRTLDNVEVDAEGTMARPRNYLLLQSPRGTLIVRDVPAGPNAQQNVETLLESGPKAQTIQCDISGRWFVTFESEEASQVALKLVQGKSVNGTPITASIKVHGPLLRGGGLVQAPFPGQGGGMAPNPGNFMGGYPGYFDPNFAFYGHQAVMPPWGQPYAYAPGMVPSFPVGPGMGMVQGQPMNYMRNPAQFNQPGQNIRRAGNPGNRPEPGRRQPSTSVGAGHERDSRPDQRRGLNNNQQHQNQQQHRRTGSQGNDADHSSNNTNGSSNAGSSKRGAKGKSHEQQNSAHAPKNKKPTKPAADAAQQNAPASSNKKKKEPAAVKPPAPELAADNFPSLPGGNPSRPAGADAGTATATSGGWNRGVRMADIVKRDVPSSPARDSKVSAAPASLSGKPAAPSNRGAGGAATTKPDAGKAAPTVAKVAAADAAPAKAAPATTANPPAPKAAPSAASQVKSAPPAQEVAKKVEAAPAKPKPTKPAWGRSAPGTSAAAIVSGRASSSGGDPAAATKAEVTAQASTPKATNPSTKKADIAAAQSNNAPAATAAAKAVPSGERGGGTRISNDEPTKPPAQSAAKAGAPKSVWGKSSSSKPSFAEMLAKGKK